MHILLFILIFIIAIVVFGLSIIGFLFRTIFGIGGRSSSRSRQYESGTHTRQQDYNQHSRTTNDDKEEIFSENAAPPKKRKKIFTKEDGEYVDYEEVKE